MKPIKQILALATLTLITACAGESPETSFPADSTPIEIGNITVGNQHPTNQPQTRVDITKDATAWENEDKLRVYVPSIEDYVVYTYTDGNWQYTAGAPFYMEDYTQGESFWAYYKHNDNSFNWLDQSSVTKYQGETYIAGHLKLSGNRLITDEDHTLTHLRIDLVITLNMGSGWNDFDEFAANVADCRFLTNFSYYEISPYLQSNESDESITLRAQYPGGFFPSPDAPLFRLNKPGGGSDEYLYGTYTGVETPTYGQRLTLEITYQKKGELTAAQAEVMDFTDVPGDFNVNPKETPDGYDHAVYSWEDLVDLPDENGNISGKIIQMADITRPAGKEWTPGYLQGLYNGNGFTLTGLNAPLFNTNGGMIYNVHLADSHVKGSGTLGLLANYNGGTITLCSATNGRVTVTGNEIHHAGGLVGYNNTGSITRCQTLYITLEGTPTGTVYAGGLVGHNEFGHITACAALRVNQTISGSGAVTFGNLVGRNGGDISYSYATDTENKTHNPIGIGNSIQYNDDSTIYTLIRDTDGTIKGETRTFNGATGNWWTKEPDYSINWAYEGE